MTVFLLPLGIGAFFTAIVISWAIGNVLFLRDETRKEIHLNLRLAEAQLNAQFDADFERTTHFVNNPNTSGGHAWFFDHKRNGLVSTDPSDHRVIPVMTDRPEKPLEAYGFDEFLASHWKQLTDLNLHGINPKAIEEYGSMSLFNDGRSLGKTLPIISSDGKIIGLAWSTIPTTLVRSRLPVGTYLVEANSSSYIAQSATDALDDATRDKLMHGEVVPNDFYSSARRLAQSHMFSDWRLWSDYPLSTIWNLPQARQAFDFPLVLIAGIWTIIFFLIRSGRRGRDRQRRLIGSLVQRIVWITDENGTVDYVLGRITSQLGWKEVDYLNVDIELFIHHDDRLALKEAIEAARETSMQEATIEIRFENKDREFRWYEVTVSNMTDVPEINGIVVTAHDIELRKHATDHILASKKAAEKANEAKSEFLSRMSHELRTPLNAILGFGQLLEMEVISDRQAENVGQILIAGRHLLNLVNDILDIARIETRKVNLSVEKVNLREVIEESFALLGPIATKNSITLEIEDLNCPDVWSDRQRLKQVALNLLSNGIKYNQAGGRVTVRAHHHAEGLILEVSDNGIGIESQYLDRLFTPFDRLGSDNSQVEGSGLGLALSKTLVEAMGASMEVQSTYGKGSTFAIHFRKSSIVKSESEAKDSNEASEVGFIDPNAFKILLVEDNVVNLRYVSKVVEKMSGVALLSAKEGGIGIEMARAHQPDLILLDLDLPDINGRDVLSSLRSDEAVGGTRIVIMSAETNPHVVEELLNLGADEFVTKPVDVNSLVSLFSEERKAA
ncbi:MAG: response regulator [Armatimonadetes bacterium]|nr:response regulator [Armatimonadota bacterium]